MTLKSLRFIHIDEEILVRYGNRFDYTGALNILQVEQDIQAGFTFEETASDFINTFNNDIENNVISPFLREVDPDGMLVRGYSAQGILHNLHFMHEHVVNEFCKKDIVQYNGVHTQGYFIDETNIDFLRNLLIEQLFTTLYFKTLDNSEFYMWELTHNPANDENVSMWHISDRDFGIVCNVVWMIYELINIMQEHEDYITADRVIMNIVSMKHDKLIEYFVALNLTVKDWCLYYKYCKHMNVDTRNDVYVTSIAVKSYRNTKEKMFRTLVEDYELRLREFSLTVKPLKVRFPGDSMLSYCNDIAITLPFNVDSFLVKIKNEVSYFLVSSLIHWLTPQFDDRNRFSVEFGAKYYNLDIRLEVFDELVSEVKRFKSLDRDTYESVVFHNIQGLWSEPNNIFNVKLSTPNLLLLVKHLEFEDYKKLWDIVNDRYYNDNEWQWEYYYIAFYYQDSNVNLERIKFRYHQLLRYNNFPVIEDLEPLSLSNVFITEEIQYYNTQEARSLPLNITYDNIIEIDIIDLGYEDKHEIVFADYINRKERNVHDTIIIDYDFHLEQADIMKSLVFDPNSGTEISLVAKFIKDPKIIVIIEIDREAYRTLWFNRLCPYSRSHLIRKQQLVIEDMLHYRRRACLMRLKSELEKSRNIYNRTERPLNITLLDTRIVLHYPAKLVEHKNNNCKDKDALLDDSEYYSQLICRSDDYNNLMLSRLKSELKLDSMDLIECRSKEFMYNENTSKKSNIIKALMKYGFNSVITLCFIDNKVEYFDTYQHDDIYRDAHLGNSGYSLYCIRFRRNYSSVNILKHDDQYLHELSIINQSSTSNTNNNNKTWQKSFSELVNRHLHTYNTTINVGEILWHGNLVRDNLPEDCIIST